MQTLSWLDSRYNENCPPGSAKDDCQPYAYADYYLLGALFIVLAVLGVQNLIRAKRLHKLSQFSTFLFYVSSLGVIFLRILLFSDPIVHWPMSIYLGVLVSLPTFLFMFIGFSQIIMSCECIVAYRNLEIKENEQLTVLERNRRINRNNSRLKNGYTVALAIGVGLIVFFVAFTIYLYFSKCPQSTCDKSY